MAYAGSTAGSSVANPPVLTQSWLAGSTNSGSTSSFATKQFIYRSTHLQTDLDDAGFITDAWNLGMRLGDSILSFNPGNIVVHHSVQTISTTGATLSAGLVVSSAS